MTNMSLLNNKRAVVFGAGGSIGAAVAKEFAAEGAEIFLAGRTATSLEATKAAISAAGGRAHTAVVDALDDGAVGEYLNGVASSGPIDIAFNAVGPAPSAYGVGKRAIDLSVKEFTVAQAIVETQFVTAQSAARQMAQQRSGVILFLTGSPVRGHVEGGAAIGAAFGAIETLMENMAFELGPVGVRVVCLRTTANTDSQTIRQVIDLQAAHLNAPRDQIVAAIAGYNFLKTPASVVDTAKAAAFLASDRARLFTGTVVNSSAGAALD